jgi:WD40 repeat protein
MGLRVIKLLIVIIFGAFFCVKCKTDRGSNPIRIDRIPVISPDYTGVTIPPNIAPMNFSILEKGESFRVVVTSHLTGFQLTITSGDGVISFPEKGWRKMLKESEGDSIIFRIYSSKTGNTVEEFNAFSMKIAREKIDPYLVYRLIYPGYYSWSDIRIIQRSTESFTENPIIENQIIEKNCANCHSFNNGNPDRFMIHIRGSLGGTYFVEDGTITKTDPKTDAMPGGATYPSWHPGGRFLAFSTNQVRQGFYSHAEKSIEVFDLVSSLILYDRKNNEILSIDDRDTTAHLLTFPSWSPDGKYLYFCRASQTINSLDPELEQIKNTHYDLARKSFDAESRSFGETEIVFNASELNKSGSFPRISPDGKYMVFTLADYGTFPIWHREADLWLLNFESNLAGRMNINSDETESYHSWSVNGKWLVFSSKRADGRSARPYFAYIDSSGMQGKEFVLPQKDPSVYDSMLESFNIPELVTGRVKVNPREFADATHQIPLKAKSGNKLEKNNAIFKESDGPIHE